MARLNLTIPDPLYRRLERLRDRVNVSKICAVALEKELEMIENGQTLVMPDARVQRLLERLHQENERRDRWYRRGRQDGEEWAVEVASVEELKEMGEEWDWDDDFNSEEYTERFDDVDEEQFPSLHLRRALEKWMRQDLEEAGDVEAARWERGRSPASWQKAWDEADRAGYLRGWHEAVRELWLVARKALPRR